jgi:hypothetical protein
LDSSTLRGALNADSKLIENDNDVLKKQDKIHQDRQKEKREREDTPKIYIRENLLKSRSATGRYRNSVDVGTSETRLILHRIYA